MDNDNYYAQINWDDQTPISNKYHDVYFSKHGAFDESNYVFLAHNQLRERFITLKPGDNFIIGETGFGAGINLVATIKLWQTCITDASIKLFFISFENHPLSLNDLQQIWRNLPGYELILQPLLDQYHLLINGIHRFNLSTNITLDLVIGDIQDTIKTREFIANAWFFDGFSPSKNPDMWNNQLFIYIAKLSNCNTTFATYSASSKVKDVLEQNGFIVSKDSGFAKREMLFGKFSGINNSSTKHNLPTPWFDQYHNDNLNKSVIIIGGGLSGANCAYALTKRGYNVDLYEQHLNLAARASGNNQGILYGNFYGNHVNHLEFAYAGYRYSYNLIKSILDPKYYDQCGLIELALNTNLAKQQRALLAHGYPHEFCSYIDSVHASKIAGIKLDYNGIYFPNGMWINPPKLVEALCSNSNIHLNQTIENFYYDETDKLWHVISNGKIVQSAANLVICNADSLDKFTQFSNLSLRKIRGQVSLINKFNNLKTIICGDGYITPSFNQIQTIGATFKFDDLTIDVKPQEHLENLQNIAKFIPEINQLDISQIIDGKAGIRVSSSDYLPLVGPIANYLEFNQVYKDLAKDSNYWIETLCPYYPGLYLNIGHGAKGIMSTPICGEIIASYIDNTPHPISKNLRHTLHPNRFWKKQLSKNL